jgi:DNA polymerase III subunit beta
VVVADAACVAFEAAVLPAASTDEAKQILTGIHLRIAGGVMTQEATDGHRLAVRSCATDAPDMDIVIPARSVRRIDGNVLLAIDNHQAAMVTADGTTIISRTFDGTYPNTQQLIPTSCTHTLTAAASSFCTPLSVSPPLVTSSNSPLPNLLPSPLKRTPAVAPNCLLLLAPFRPAHSMPPT